MYTSGTTGVSEGTLPLFHLAGQWYGVYQGLIHQVPCYVTPGFSVSRFWDTVREQGITFIVTLGAMAETLYSMSEIGIVLRRASR